MTMSCALRKPGFYPEVMKSSVAICHPHLQDSQLPSSFTWRWHRLCCHQFACSLSLHHCQLQLSTFFIRTVSADFLLTSTLIAHLLSLPSSSKPEKTTQGLVLYGTVSGSPWVQQHPERLLPYCRWFWFSLWVFMTCPLTPTPQGLSTLLIPSTSVSQSPLQLTDLVTFLTGSPTGRTMTPSCLPPPVLLSSPITTLSWLSSTSSSLHPMQCILRPGTSLPLTSTPSDPIFRPD